MTCAPNGRGKVALVLAGGAARGAYEVGVVQHILEDVARDLGRDPPLDILCGTSVGALNTCGLAAFADYPRARARRLVEVWSHLTIDRVLSIDRGELFALARAIIGRPPPLAPDAQHGPGLVDPSAIERLITEVVPFARIQQHLDAGLLSAVTVTATHVGSGRTVVFVAQKESLGVHWSTDPTMIGEKVMLEPVHALASAAIPVLFPAVRVGGEFYCDGGLRQNVPLSPARRLGADGIVVVSPRYLPLHDPGPPVSTDEARANEQAFPGPLFLLGKTLNALLLDRLDSDIDRLRRINKILDAGCRRFGPQLPRRDQRSHGPAARQAGHAPARHGPGARLGRSRQARRRVRARGRRSCSATAACSAASCAAWPTPRAPRRRTSCRTCSSTASMRAS